MAINPRKVPVQFNDPVILSILSDRILTVGSKGRYADIPSALTAAALLIPSATNRVIVKLLPGTHILAASVTFADYVDLIGVDRDTCIISATGTSGSILYSLRNTFSDFTFNCAITGGGTKHAMDRASGVVVDTTGSTMRMQNLIISYTNLVSGAMGSCIRLSSASTYIEMHNVNFLTSKVGVYTNGLSFVKMYNCNIWLLDLDSNYMHCGLYYAAGGGRIILRNCQISAGYGPVILTGSGGIANESDQNMYGVLVTAAAGVSTRVELYDLWCIVRNETGANAGVHTQAVRCESNGYGATQGVVRIHGGYYQAEDGGSDLGERYDIAKIGTGNIQVRGGPSIGNLVYGRLDGFGGEPSGYSTLTTNTTLTPAMSGTYIIDSSGGNITVTLPTYPDHNEQYIFVRSSAANVVTITAGAGMTINGAASYVMPATAYATADMKHAGVLWVNRVG